MFAVLFKSQNLNIKLYSFNAHYVWFNELEAYSRSNKVAHKIVQLWDKLEKLNRKFIFIFLGVK